MTRLVFERDFCLSVPVCVCLECGNRFLAGQSRALHKPGCSCSGYDNCFKTIGPAVVQRVASATLGATMCLGHVAPGDVSLMEIKASFPNVVAEAVARLTGAFSSN